MKSLTVVFNGKNELEVRDVEVREPGPNQVQVQTKCSLISTGTECICLHRKFAPGTNWDGWVKYPFFPGYSMVGRVVKLGPDVKNVKEGDRVACHVNHTTLVNVGVSGLFPVPDGLAEDQATFGKLAYITQHGFRRAKLQIGEIVVVIGVGLLGQLIVQYAKLAGAGEVIAIDTAQKRLDMAKKLGATHTLCMPVDQAVAEVKKITGGKMADVVFDMTGHAAVFASALELPRRFGRVVLIGDTGTPAEQHLIHNFLGKDLTLIGAHDTNAPRDTNDYTPWSTQAMVALFYKYLLRGQMNVADMITHRFPLKKARDAYDLLTDRRDEAMGVILEF